MPVDFSKLKDQMGDIKAFMFKEVDQFKSTPTYNRHDKHYAHFFLNLQILFEHESKIRAHDESRRTG